GYRKVLATLYKPANFFDRLKNLIGSLKGSRNETLGRLGLRTQIKFFFPLIGAMFRLTADAHRAEYWKFMVWVLRNHPDKILFALCRIIGGYHFIRYTADVMVPRLTLLELELMEKEQAPSYA